MKLCEVYTSVQGEGPNTGKPITFVRFGGCNLRCPGWGEGTLPDGTIVPGCDTTFAVYPEWRDTWESKSVEQILQMIPIDPARVCLTGGEPLIQPSRQMNELVSKLSYGGYAIDLFTNGSQVLPSWGIMNNVTVVMDYKLPGSGEYGSFLGSNLARLRPKDAIKFVCKDEHDFAVAVGTIKGFNLNQGPSIWFGVAWGTLDPGRLSEMILETDLPAVRLNLQMHKYLWDPNERER